MSRCSLARSRPSGISRAVQIDFGLDMIGFTDARNCFTRGDVGACVGTLIQFIPWGKVFKLGKAIYKLADKFLAFTKRLRAWEDKAEELARATETAAQSCGLRSFSGDTPVTMADGSHKPISSVAVGDEVLATDPETGQQSGQRVEAVWVHLDSLYELSTTGEILTTTEDHPFWSVTDHRFERTDELAPGEVLLDARGRAVPVSDFDPSSVRVAVAYNLSVSTIHTYHVGRASILVHNGCSDEAWDIAHKAFDKHGESLGFSSIDETGEYVDEVMGSGPGHLRDDGSTFWVDAARQVIVFRGPSRATPGSVYRPDNFERAVEQEMKRTDW